MDGEGVKVNDYKSSTQYMMMVIKSKQGHIEERKDFEPS